MPAEATRSEILSDEELLQLLDAARWAPSGDNDQPWRVRRAGAALELVLADSYQPAFLDVGCEASRVAVGAFIESLRLATSELGLACDAELAAERDEPVWARLQLARGRSVARDPLAACLRERHSNRRLYAAEPCSDEELEALGAAARVFPEVGLRLYRRPEELATLGRAVAAADRVRFRNAACHTELHRKIHWRRDNSGRGFLVDTFELAPHERLALRLTRPLALMRLVTTVTPMVRVASAYAARQVRSSGAVGMLALAERSPAALMRAGMALERVWLTATARGLAFQVLAVLPLLARRLACGAGGLDTRESEAIRQAAALAEQLPDAPPMEQVVVMFRIGRAAPASARTGRLPPGALLLP